MVDVGTDMSVSLIRCLVFYQFYLVHVDELYALPLPIFLSYNDDTDNNTLIIIVCLSIHQMILLMDAPPNE